MDSCFEKDRDILTRLKFFFCLKLFDQLSQCMSYLQFSSTNYEVCLSNWSRHFGKSIFPSTGIFPVLTKSGMLSLFYILQAEGNFTFVKLHACEAFPRRQKSARVQASLLYWHHHVFHNHQKRSFQILGAQRAPEHVVSGRPYRTDSPKKNTSMCVGFLFFLIGCYLPSERRMSFVIRDKAFLETEVWNKHATGKKKRTLASREWKRQTTAR